jgi:hypothetical protein
VTEAEWLECQDAQKMHRFLRDVHHCHVSKAGKRKLRLFGCACCRLRWDDMTEPRSRAAVEYVERLADERADIALLEQVREAARVALHAVDLHWVTAPHQPAARVAEKRAAEAAFMLVTEKAADSAWVDPCMRTSYGRDEAGSPQEKEYRAWRGRLHRLAHLLRDIFGNPFRTVTLNSPWRSRTVIALAHSIYESRDFSVMPILADALEEGGCNDASILAHCRGSRAFHVRGCWVLDLLRV